MGRTQAPAAFAEEVRGNSQEGYGQGRTAGNPEEQGGPREAPQGVAPIRATRNPEGGRHVGPGSHEEDRQVVQGVDERGTHGGPGNQEGPEGGPNHLHGGRVAPSSWGSSLGQ